jgi:hypothetical protein
MTPKEKADELVDRFCPLAMGETYEHSMSLAKQCALICCDEILRYEFPTSVSYKLWEKTKEELEKL